MLREPRQALSFRFSTADIEPRHRATAVRELRERGILPIEPLRRGPVSLQITKCFLPGVGILSGTLAGVRQEGNPKAPGASDDLFFGINVAGRSIAVQRGREITFGDGDAVLLSCAAGTFSVARPTPVRFVGLRVPHKVIAPLVNDHDDRMMRIAPRSRAALKLLIDYLEAIAKLPSTDLAETSHAIALHLHDLIALSAGPKRDAAALADRSVRAARLRAIKSDLEESLADGGLTVADIAVRQGVTPRYVQKLFEAEGTTFTQFVLRQRLNRAYRMLRDPRFMARNITSIAYDAGFGDLSYSNRTFRRCFNATPSDVRNEPVVDR